MDVSTLGNCELFFFQPMTQRINASCREKCFIVIRTKTRNIHSIPIGKKHTGSFFSWLTKSK